MRFTLAVLTLCVGSCLAKPAINGNFNFKDDGPVLPTIQRVNLTLPSEPVIHKSEVIQVLNPETGATSIPHIAGTTSRPSSSPNSEISAHVLPLSRVVRITTSEVGGPEVIPAIESTTTTVAPVTNPSPLNTEQMPKPMMFLLLFLVVLMMVAGLGLMSTNEMNFYCERVTIRRDFKRVSRSNSSIFEEDQLQQ